MSVIREWLSLPKVELAEDYGFFGPESVSWRVWSYPTSLSIGFQRAVVIEELDPGLIAAVDKTHEIYSRPRTRYDRTLRYFAMVAFDDSRSTAKAADVLVKIHSKAIGVDPVTGENYDANNPDSQLWIHLTAWHSILLAYEKYGPGRLSDEDEAQFLSECARAAELQTCDPGDIPRTREGIGQYFEKMRPQLIGSDIARQAMRHLLSAEVMLPPMPLLLRPFTKVITWFLRRGTLATMPRWMREMAGLSVAPPARRGDRATDKCRLRGDQHEQAAAVDPAAADLTCHRAHRRTRSALGTAEKLDHHDAQGGAGTLRL